MRGASAYAEALDLRIGAGVSLTPYLTAQGDYAAFSHDEPGGQASGANLRRMQVGGTFKIQDQFEVGYIYDFGHSAGGSPRTLTADISYVGLKPFDLTLGIQKPQFSMESMEDGADIVFIERASISNVTRDVAASSGREAIQLQGSRHRWLVAAAVTGGLTGETNDGRQRAIVGRAVGLLVDTRNLTIEVGGSGQHVYRLADGVSAAPSISLSEYVELSVSGAIPSVTTGSLTARRVSVAGGEGSIRAGRLLLQGEGYSVDFDRMSGAPDLPFHGGYVQAAYTILGSPRSWDEKLGVWATPRTGPDQGSIPGAIEIAARYTEIDLDEDGGQQTIWTAAINWWPVNPVRLTAELLHGEVTGGMSPRVVNAAAGRVQLHF